MYLNFEYICKIKMGCSSATVTVGKKLFLFFYTFLETSTQGKCDAFHTCELSVPLDYCDAPCSQPKVKHTQIFDGNAKQQASISK